jgi:imidazolonepropionase-like amidohydrolase
LSKGSPLTQRSAMMEPEEDFDLTEAELDAFDAMADSGHEVSASTDDNDDDF